jgi:hypothetical protein
MIEFCARETPASVPTETMDYIIEFPKTGADRYTIYNDGKFPDGAVPDNPRAERNALIPLYMA